MLKKVSAAWLLTVMALLTFGVISTTGPPALVHHDGVVISAVTISAAESVSFQRGEVVLISPVLSNIPERGLDRFIAINKHKQIAQVQPMTANWRDNTGGRAIPALIVRSVASQAIFVREPADYWLRV